MVWHGGEADHAAMMSMLTVAETMPVVANALRTTAGCHERPCFVSTVASNPRYFPVPPPQTQTID